MYDENGPTEKVDEETPTIDEELKDLLYIGVKIIFARPMDECTFLVEHKGQDVMGRETREGYRVTYPDGYISWSPKNVFETAYRVVTFGELAFIK